MSTKKIFFILGSIILFFVGLVLYNLVLNNPRTFSLITLDRFEACFLIPSDISIEKTDTGFKYKLKNNYGEFKLISRGLDNRLNSVKVGDFEMAYEKLVNDRIFEYKLSEDFILKDRFIVIKKMQPNLVPLKSKCESLKKRYKVMMEIE